MAMTYRTNVGVGGRHMPMTYRANIGVERQTHGHDLQD